VKHETDITQASNPGRIGIYIIPVAGSAVDQHKLLEFARKVPGVVHTRTVTARPAPDPAALAREIAAADITRIVLAGEHPGFLKAAFNRAMNLAGKDAAAVKLASYAERGECITTERAILVLDETLTESLSRPAPVPVPAPDFNDATLVIGGGVAGIQAALEIAESGHPVYLVERSGTIGGRMAMFDKTFPTLDCAACILTPKMVAVGQSSKIKLMVLSEVQDVTGSVGRFHIKVLRHATRVDASACVACGDCAKFCPITVASEFDMGVAMRKNIYIPFPQAVPNAYMIDPEHCTWVLSDGTKCGVCVKKCSKGAVHLDAKDETVEIDVGNIIVATGYDMLDAHKVERYGYGKHPNVLTSLEFERLTNASGPTGGKIVMKSLKLNKKTKQEEWVFDPEGEKPKRVAIVHCVGSRDRNYNHYCSRVCCMYSLKFAHLVREKAPEAECHEYYIDMRAFGKGYEEFHERIREEGVHLVRGRSMGIEERDGQLYLIGEDTLSQQLLEQPVDMVILSAGLQPSHGSDELGKLLSINHDGDGWFRELSYNAAPNSTVRDGIYVAGVCQSPKDIPDTVAQASAAAGEVLRSIVGATAAALDVSTVPTSATANAGVPAGS
jgi:heterodisulfide reductase subunit A